MNDEILIAREWLNRSPVYLDTETTGLDSHAQIVEIAILDDTGRAILDTRVRPTVPIPPAATSIHRIADADVAGYPTFVELFPAVKEIIAVAGRLVVIYNSQFDLRMMYQSLVLNGAFTIDGRFWNINEFSVGCAMLLYADYDGDWDEYHGNNRWHRLEDACLHLRIPTNDVRAHSAAGDCELTRRLIHAMAAQKLWQVPVTKTQNLADSLPGKNHAS